METDFAPSGFEASTFAAVAGHVTTFSAVPIRLRAREPAKLFASTREGSANFMRRSHFYFFGGTHAFACACFDATVRTKPDGGYHRVKRGGGYQRHMLAWRFPTARIMLTTPFLSFWRRPSGRTRRWHFCVPGAARAFECACASGICRVKQNEGYQRHMPALLFPATRMVLTTRFRSFWRRPPRPPITHVWINKGNATMKIVYFKYHMFRQARGLLLRDRPPTAPTSWSTTSNNKRTTRLRR